MHAIGIISVVLLNIWMHVLCTAALKYTISYISRPVSLLHSFGDPGFDSESKALRTIQGLFRKWERAWFRDNDAAGMTFTTPVIWAPWLETAWMGNYYDYRSAYFHDTMYSNHAPKREGALLFPSSKQQYQVALLYQRYPKFSEASYSLSNVTLFNIFAAKSLRLGRYKYAQSDQVLLCITDPLTTSSMKRYLNSFNALKWFKAKYLQLVRKRQYEMRVAHTGDDTFFAEAVYNIEYGNGVAHIDSLNLKNPRTIPVGAVDFPDSVVQCNEEQIAELVLPLSAINVQYAFESLWDTLLSVTGIQQVSVTADAHPLTQLGVDVLRRVAAAHQVVASTAAKKTGASTASAAANSHTIQLAVNNCSCGIINDSLTVRVHRNADSGADTERSIGADVWQQVLSTMRNSTSVRIIPARM